MFPPPLMKLYDQSPLLILNIFIHLTNIEEYKIKKIPPYSQFQIISSTISKNFNHRPQNRIQFKFYRHIPTSNLTSKHPSPIYRIFRQIFISTHDFRTSTSLDLVPLRAGLAAIWISERTQGSIGREKEKKRERGRGAPCRRGHTVCPGIHIRVCIREDRSWKITSYVTPERSLFSRFRSCSRTPESRFPIISRLWRRVISTNAIFKPSRYLDVQRCVTRDQDHQLRITKERFSNSDKLDARMWRS